MLDSRVAQVEHEIKHEMASALGQAEGRLQRALSMMQDEKLKASMAGSGSVGLQEAVKNYNYYRERAVKLREELVMQREAAGFSLNNRKVVHDMHPIADLLDKQGEHTKMTIDDPAWVRQVEAATSKEKGYVLGAGQARASRLGLPARNVKEWLGT